jgi:hypothetical protein
LSRLFTRLLSSSFFLVTNRIFCLISCIRGSGTELVQTISAAVAFGKIVFRSLLALLVFQSGRFVRQAGRSSLSLSLSLSHPLFLSHSLLLHFWRLIRKFICDSGAAAAFCCRSFFLDLLLCQP